MRSLASLLLLVGLLGTFGWTATVTASRSHLLRRRLLVGGIVALLGATFAILWFTPRIPETPGSPGTMVMLLLLWLIGGGIGIIGLATIIGAALASPTEE